MENNITFRSLGDTAAARDGIFNKVLTAAGELQPISSKDNKWTLTLQNPFYAEKEEPTPDEIKKSVLSGGSINRTLKGDWVLTDNETGEQRVRRTVVAKVPYLLNNGTFLRGGTKYAMRNQQRLSPGVYVHQQEDGYLDAHVNADMSEGAVHHYNMDPSTGVFSLKVGMSKTPIYGLAKALGVQDEELESVIGKELTEINRKQYKPAHLAKLYQQLGRNRTATEDPEVMSQGIRDSLGNIKFDPELTQITLGQPHANYTKDTFLAAIGKLYKASRGEADLDDRDSLVFQKVMTPEDIFEERLRKDAGKMRRNLFYTLTQKWKGDISKLPAGALTKQLDGALLDSGLGANPEEINGLDVFDKFWSITKMGTGGLQSSDAIPESSRNVSPSHRGFIDPARTPESLRAGVDVFLASGAKRGSDGQIYSTAMDINGNEKMMRPRDFHNSVVAFASEYRRTPDGGLIAVMDHGKERMATKEKVDTLLPHFETAFSPLANLVPMKSATGGKRVTMGSRMFAQAMALEGGEAPLVQSADANGRSYYDIYSDSVGAVRAKQNGVVLGSDDKNVQVQYEDGSRETIPLQRYMVGNRQSYVDQTPVITKGQPFEAGQTIIRSNQTDENGTINLGMNARTVMMPWKGMNFEDGFVISQSFADKMKSQHMYQHKMEWQDGEYAQGKHRYMGIFPGNFQSPQLDKLDKNGIVQVGQVVEEGDPLVLAARPNDDPLSKKKKKRLFADAAIKWEHHAPGVVTDVHTDEKGVNVVVVSLMSTQSGDKFSTRFGTKGVVNILPDDEMPMYEDGSHAELVLSPSSILSRNNPSVVAELALAKIAKKTGKPYRITDFESDESLVDFVERELKANEVDPGATIIDPKTGKQIRNLDGSGIGDGYLWTMKLHHTSEKKGGARGFGSYSASGEPAKGGEDGAKRMAMSAMNALIAHGSPNVFMDAKYNRGQMNDEFWLNYMRGQNPVNNKTPLVFEKFVNSLKASGVNIEKSKDGRINVMAMTDKDIQGLAGNREVKSGETVRWEGDKRPIMGGLMDTAIFGADGDRWAKITNAVPILNSVMETPARILLGMTGPQLKAVMEGKEELGGMTGQAAIAKALNNINVDRQIEQCRVAMKETKGAKRDEAVRRLGYLKAAKDTGVLPKDWMLSSIPVIPPKFRPISEMQGGTALIDDANHLYKQFLDLNNGLKDLKKITKNTHAEEAALYDAYSQITGLSEPTNPKFVQRNVRGLLKAVFGVGSSKFSMVQRSLLGATVDTVGRGVITSNPNIGIDEIGLPEDMAWEVYRPHVVHALGKRGIPWAVSSQYVEDKNAVAKEALLQEMEKRPVIVTRDPILHKGSMFAFRPHLVAGDTIDTNQFLNKAYGADMDGDMMNFHVPFSDRAVKEAYKRMLPSKNLLQDTDFKSAEPRLISEQAGGTFLASLEPLKDAPTKHFATLEEAKKAYRRGDISMRDPITIGR